MKFRGLKNTWLGRNKKTGQTEEIKIGETIEKSYEDIEQIESLIRDLAITPLDDGLVKDNARYKILHSFRIDFNGETVTGKAGSEPTFPRGIATLLLAQGYVRPVNEDNWYPGKPSHIREGAAKRMYDDLGEGTGNQPGFITSWKEKE